MTNFAAVSRSIESTLRKHLAAVDRDAEWQRVNSYIADVLKDAHVLYAKLARLQGDFGGAELTELEKISEGVLGLGGKLSEFSKAFYEGSTSMQLSDVYGEGEGAAFGGSPETPSYEEPPASPASEPEEEAPVDLEFDYGTEDDEEKKEE